MEDIFFMGPSLWNLKVHGLKTHQSDWIYFIYIKLHETCPEVATESANIHLYPYNVYTFVSMLGLRVPSGNLLYIIPRSQIALPEE